MNFYTQLRFIEKRFLLVITGLVVLSVFALGIFMYEANIVRFSSDATSEDLAVLVQDQPEVAAYLAQEKDFEAHFITITNLVKQDQQQELGRILIFATLGTIVVAAGAGWLAARYLLKPVRLSYQSQERFLQDAAHELRNPLAAMSTALQNEQRSSKKSYEDLVVTMRRQTNRLIRINEDLLYLERRRPGAKIERINVSNLLGDILEDLQPMIAAKKLTFSSDIADTIEYVIDPSDFIKLSRNIIENAIKYTPKGQSVAVKLAKTKAGFTLQVTDTGIGIPSKDLDQIGERFFRASNAQKHSGTGLGLAIVHKVAHTYGGDVSITSEPKQGTVVTINL